MATEHSILSRHHTSTTPARDKRLRANYWEMYHKIRVCCTTHSGKRRTLSIFGVPRHVTAMIEGDRTSCLKTTTPSSRPPRDRAGVLLFWQFSTYSCYPRSVDGAGMVDGRWDERSHINLRLERASLQVHRLVTDFGLRPPAGSQK